MEQQTKKAAIEMVKKSFPTIFAKEDVLQLLNSISDEGGEITDEQREEIIEEAKEEMKEDLEKKVRDAIGSLNLGDYVEKDTADFSLNRREIELDSVDLDESGLTDAIIDGITF
jgi:uncharacterized membrane protein YheB (UPF0754 family)